VRWTPSRGPCTTQTPAVLCPAAGVSSRQGHSRSSLCGRDFSSNTAHRARRSSIQLSASRRVRKHDRLGRAGKWSAPIDVARTTSASPDRRSWRAALAEALLHVEARHACVFVARPLRQVPDAMSFKDKRLPFRIDDGAVYLVLSVSSVHRARRPDRSERPRGDWVIAVARTARSRAAVTSRRP
jgi:hypothetical protein